MQAQSPVKKIDQRYHKRNSYQLIKQASTHEINLNRSFRKFIHQITIKATHERIQYQPVRNLKSNFDMTYSLKEMFSEIRFKENIDKVMITTSVERIPFYSFLKYFK